MRKLKLQVQMSLDGYIAGPNGEMDWMNFAWTDDLNNYVTHITEPVDTIILGRKLAEGFIPHWANVASDKDNPEVESGRKFTDTYKVVFTKTIKDSDPRLKEWKNTVLAKGDLVEEINKLKQQNGKDIIAYGGATFVSDLIKHGLIDEYHLFINPSAIGNGMPIFNELDKIQNMELAKSKTFDCGIVLLNYKIKRS